MSRPLVIAILNRKSAEGHSPGPETIVGGAKGAGQAGQHYWTNANRTVPCIGDDTVRVIVRINNRRVRKLARAESFRDILN